MGNIDFKLKAEEFLAEENLITPEGRSLLVYTQNQFQTYDGKKYRYISHDSLGVKILQLAHKKETYLEKYNQYVIREIVRNLEAICLKENIERGVFFGEKKSLNKFYTPYRNGILETNLLPDGNVTKSLMPHSPEFYSSYCLEYDYQEDPVTPEVFLRIISEILTPDQQLVFQELLGYFLTYYTNLEVMLFLVGDGANGKSLLCLLISLILGDDNISSVRIEDLFGDPFFLIETEGKLLNMSEEASGGGRRLPVDKIKDFISGGKHYANQKYKARYPFYPTARLMFACNSMPLLSDNSDAVKRRLIVLELKNQFLDPKKRDIRLKDKEFWIASGELPAISNWAREGLIRLHRNTWTLSLSDDISTKLDELDSEFNPIKSFIKDYLVLDPRKWIWSKDLYQVYLKYCRMTLEREEKHSDFTKAIRSHFKPHVGLSNPRWRESRNGDKFRDRQLTGLDFKPDEAQVTPMTQEVFNQSSSDQ